MGRLAVSVFLGLGLVACDGAFLGPRGTPVVPPVVAPVEPELPPFMPAPLRPRLLLGAQYRNAVSDLLGPEAARAVTPPRDVVVNGLSAIGASSLEISSAQVSDAEANAYLAAQAALAARAGALVACAPASSTDAACMRRVAEQLVPLAFRRPASSDELTRWTDVGVAAARASDDFRKGVEFLVAGLLQSPHFLYLEELGEPDPADSTRRRLTANELASRLSFFLTNAPPDEALRAAAASGELTDVGVLRAQAARLLETPRARAAAAFFFDELLELRGLSHLAKDSARFPGFDVALGASMAEETHRTLLAAAFDEAGDFRDVFTTTRTFVDAPLARHYGLGPVAGWTRVDAAPGRAGILTQAGFLSLMSHPSANSPTHRGRFIREKLMCQTIPAPPPNVSTTLPPTAPGTRRTLRQRLAVHMAAPACSGCHTLMDPPGFAFEGFDAVGQRQSTDDGLPVDTSGDLDGATFSDAAGLMATLHDDPRVTRCLTRTLFRHATGHVDLASEARPLKAAHDAFAAAGFRYQSLLLELVTSEAFRAGVVESP
jgi:hypothetical protein